MMLTKTKAAFAAALVLGTASSALAEPAGVPEELYPKPWAAREAAPATIFEGRNVAVRRTVKPFTAAEKVLFDRANGSSDH